MSNPSLVTIHMAASLDGFIARKDGRVDWMETADEFADGATMDPGFVEAFLKTIDCYVMGSQETCDAALAFENKGFGWAYGDKPTFVLTESRSAANPGYGRVSLRRPRAVRERTAAPKVCGHLVRGRRDCFRRMSSARAGRRSSLFDPADPDRRWDFPSSTSWTVTSRSIWRR